MRRCDGVNRFHWPGAAGAIAVYRLCARLESGRGVGQEAPPPALEREMPDPTATTRDARTSVAPILAVNFVGTLGFSIVMPFMVFLVTRWGGNAIVYGVLASTYSLFQLLGAPLLGRWSDRVGRRRVLLLSQLGTLVSWLIFLGAFALPETVLLSVDSATLGPWAFAVSAVIVLGVAPLGLASAGNPTRGEAPGARAD